MHEEMRGLKAWGIDYYTFISVHGPIHHLFHLLNVNMLCDDINLAQPYSLKNLIQSKIRPVH